MSLAMKPVKMPAGLPAWAQRWRGLWQARGATAAWLRPGPALTLSAPQDWPGWLRYLVGVAVFAVLLLMLWFFWLLPLADQLAGAQQTEQQLRADLRARQDRLALLTALPAQQAQAQQRLKELEKQLPGPADMHALLSALSRAALARQLQIGLLRPQAPAPGPLYADQRMALQLTGRFEDLSGFAMDLASLPWPVAVHSFTLLPAQGDTLRMDMGLRTLRMLPAVQPSVTSELALQPALLPVTSKAVSPERSAALSPQPGLGLAPFNSLRLLPVAPVAVPAPARTAPGRFKPPLESAPLAAMRMVGSVLGTGPPVALLRVNGRIYLVRVGDRLGLDQGQVSDIGPAGLALREPASSESGDKLEKTVRLNLVQEPP
jgi:type IV pilus assembly protein PilO